MTVPIGSECRSNRCTQVGLEKPQELRPCDGHAHDAMTGKRPGSGDKLARFLEPPTQRERAARSVPPSAVVTTVHRYQRPPPKRKAVPLTGPAIVTTTNRKRAKLDRADRRRAEDPAPDTALREGLERGRGPAE
jgi:hypothetical protein